MAIVRRIVLESCMARGTEMPLGRVTQLVDSTVANPFVIVVSGEPFQVVEVEFEDGLATHVMRPTSIRYSA